MRNTEVSSRSEFGSALVEYLLIVALIAAVTIPIVKTFSENAQYQIAALDIELGGGTEGAGGQPE